MTRREIKLLEILFTCKKVVATVTHRVPILIIQKGKGQGRKCRRLFASASRFR